jgi:hypothetical protein
VPAPSPSVPVGREGEFGSSNSALKRFHADCERLGLRKRRQHDLRRSFISLARDGGARKDVLETITHNARGEVIDQYTSFSWPVMCAEVAKLQLDLDDRRTPQWTSSPVWLDWFRIHGQRPLSGQLEPERAPTLLQGYCSPKKRNDSAWMSGGADGTRTRRSG